MTNRAFQVVLCVVSLTSSPRLQANDWENMKSITPRHYVCYRADKPIEIDGELTDLSWQRAPWTDDFQDIEGSRKPKPTWRTRAKLLWDRRYLYVAAELEEPHVWGAVTERDAVIFQDNDFEIFIDPNGDNHEYYEFEMNALNTVWDLFLRKPYKDGGQAMNNWDIEGLRTAVHVNGTLNRTADTDGGWTLEVAFPWKALERFAHRSAPPHEGDQWRVNFSRVEWDTEVIDGRYQKVAGRPEHNWVWSPQGIVDMHRPERWAYVQFTAQWPRDVSFEPDVGASAREALMAIYHAQRTFHQRTGGWAATPEQLHLDSRSFPGVSEAPRIRWTAEGYVASVAVKSKRGARQVWRIRQDSKLWRR